ncbi:adenosylhomocysteinase [Bombiscardovia nodaiensis]|uniref:Adenosylhomocysteinase n=1 Tax=Bombiscardovia nodaiensis TaxID=2932181 RepID=A0ABM8B6S9_9BIFI|nr:adenosylhomocysteinase [Bombiscardovia nodaiensis]
MSQQQTFDRQSDYHRSDRVSPLDFASWARAYSQRTNRSLAGSRIVLPDDLPSSPERDLLVSQAHDWGMSVSQAHNSDAPTTFSTYYPQSADVPDMRESTGAQAMDWAQEHMPVLRALVDQFCSEHDTSQLRIAMCLILEPKTAILARLLAQAGAQVGIYAGPETLDPRVAQQLRSEGIAVYANPNWNQAQSVSGALELLDTLGPNLIIDDGASFARLAARERPELAAQLIGVAEETTSGVRAFDAMEADQVLPFPVVAVNDSLMKTGFDNAHGTGETCATTIQELLGSGCFENCQLAVIGYGPVGRGFAQRVRTLGAQVTICDSDPRACLRAAFEGFPTRNIDQVLPTSDMVISATGVYHTVSLEQMRAMRPSAVLAVIGGIANELALDDLPSGSFDHSQPVSDLQVPDGPRLKLLSSGDGVNYTAGGGNPIEIMDLSFAVQTSALAWLLDHRGQLKTAVYRLPEQVDRQIAEVALQARGYETSPFEPQTDHSWQVTRFDQPNGAASSSL